MWEKLVDHLRGNIWRARVDAGDERPVLTHHCSLGDNWYSCANMGPVAVGKWMHEVMLKEVLDEIDRRNYLEARRNYLEFAAGHAAEQQAERGEA